MELYRGEQDVGEEAGSIRNQEEVGAKSEEVAGLVLLPGSHRS